MEQQDDNIFDIRLNNTGRNYIKRFASTIRWIFFLVILLVLGEIGLGVFTWIKLSDNSWGSTWLMERRIELAIGFVLAILSIVQSWLLWKTGKAFSACIAAGNETTFNEAFGYLAKYGTWALILTVVTLLLAIFNYYMLFKYLV